MPTEKRRNQGKSRRGRSTTARTSSRPITIPQDPAVHSIGPAPQSAVMNALSRYAHPVYDAIQSARRYGRVPEGQANPFAALASFGGMDDPLSMIGGPAAAAAAPLSRVGRMAPMMERVPGAAAAAPPPGAAGMVRGQPSTAALPGETEAQRIARLEQRAREWAAEQLRMLDAPPQPQAAYPVGRSGGMMLEGAVPGPLPRRRATPGGRYALGEG